MATIKQDGAFVDTECKIEHEGQTFESGGAFIAKRKDTGRYEGIMYGDYEMKTVSNWDGSIQLPARYYGEHRGNMGDRRVFCEFEYEGRKFFGRWFGMDWSQIVRVRERK